MFKRASFRTSLNMQCSLKIQDIYEKNHVIKAHNIQHMLYIYIYKCVDVSTLAAIQKMCDRLMHAQKYNTHISHTDFVDLMLWETEPE